jgi:hypothetical protein
MHSDTDRGKAWLRLDSSATPLDPAGSEKRCAGTCPVQGAVRFKEAKARDCRSVGCPTSQASPAHSCERGVVSLGTAGRRVSRTGDLVVEHDASLSRRRQSSPARACGNVS